MQSGHRWEMLHRVKRTVLKILLSKSYRWLSPNISYNRIWRFAGHKSNQRGSLLTTGKQEWDNWTLSHLGYLGTPGQSSPFICENTAGSGAWGECMCCVIWKLYYCASVQPELTRLSDDRQDDEPAHSQPVQQEKGKCERTAARWHHGDGV